MSFNRDHRMELRIFSSVSLPSLVLYRKRVNSILGRQNILIPQGMFLLQRRMEIAQNRDQKNIFVAENADTLLTSSISSFSCVAFVILKLMFLINSAQKSGLSHPIFSCSVAITLPA